MNSIELMEGFAKRLKAAIRELRSLEQQAKKLAEKEQEIRAERDSFEQEIARYEDAIATLETEDSAVRGRLLEAMLSDDTSTESRLKQRRKEIATEIDQHRDEIRRVRESLDGLEDTEVAAAELAAKLDMLTFGNAWLFATQLRNVLVSNESELKSRQGIAKGQLPKYSQEVYSEIRSHLDEEYAAKQERDGMSEVEYLRFQKRKAEREMKEVAANREYVGVGAFGGERRTEPDVRDFSG